MNCVTCWSVAVCYCYSLTVHECMFFHSNVWENVQKMMETEFPKAKPEDREKYVALVKECLCKRDHMTVFQMDVSDSAREIDLVILQALLKGLSCFKLLLSVPW